MGFLSSRAYVIRTFVSELIQHGLPEVDGAVDREAVFILDGVGGFQFVPLLVRKAFRHEVQPPGTIMIRWQFKIPGIILADLMWNRRNRKMAARFTEQLERFRGDHPHTPMHVVAFSGGTGIAVWACERIGEHLGIQTLILACPAMSPTYNLAACLKSVRRCYALVSRRDRVILGLGTRVFGTVDREYRASAGLVGFRRPEGLTLEETQAYDRMVEIRWTPELIRLGHKGGHAGWAHERFLRAHLLPMLRGMPQLPVQPIL